jgi:hypothetical protein
MTEPLFPDLLTTFDVRCPYCRHLNTFRIQPGQAASLARSGRTNFRDLMTCENEGGGCDFVSVIEVEAKIVFDVTTLPLAGVGLEVEPAHDSDGAPTVRALAERPEPFDARVWSLRTRAADEPGDSTHSFNVAELQAAAKSSPLYALALTMRGDDKLHFTSTEGLISYAFECYEPEESERFFSFVLARREARRRALNAGAPVEIYFDGEGFRLYRTRPLPVPPPAPDFEHVATVEVPVLFRITTTRIGVHSTIDAPEGYHFAEVFCDDERANPDLQRHGNSEVFRSEPWPTPEEAVRAAANFIRSEFAALDAVIEAPFPLEDLSDEPPADDLTDDRRIEDRD